MLLLLPLLLFLFLLLSLFFFFKEFSDRACNNFRFSSLLFVLPVTLGISVASPTQIRSKSAQSLATLATTKSGSSSRERESLVQAVALWAALVCSYLLLLLLLKFSLQRKNKISCNGN